jgi:hypothetical protein
MEYQDLQATNWLGQERRRDIGDSHVKLLVEAKGPKHEKLLGQGRPRDRTRRAAIDSGGQACSLA